MHEVEDHDPVRLFDEDDEMLPDTREAQLGDGWAIDQGPAALTHRPSIGNVATLRSQVSLISLRLANPESPDGPMGDLCEGGLCAAR